MLHILRSQKVQKRIYIVLAIAVIASFGVSGVLISHDDQKSNSSIGKIHGKRISVQDYLASYKAVDHQVRMMYGQAFDQVRGYINMKGEAWDRLLLLSYARQHGIKASDQEVVDWISRQSFLQNHGQFDDRLYKMFVSEYLKADVRRFEEEVREMLTIGKIQEKMEAGIRVEDAELKQLYTQQHGEREIEYVIFSAASDPNAAISEEDLKKIYPLYENNLREPAKAKIRYLFVPTEKESPLKDALADDKSTLDALSSKYGLTAAESAYFSKNEAIPGLGLVSEINDKSFSLNPHENSGWITTATGHYKIELADKKPAKALSFEEAKDKLKEIWAHQKTVESSLKELNDLTKGLKPADFEKFAADHKLELKSMKQYKEGSYIPGIGPSKSVEKALASVSEGGLTKPTPVPGGAALMKVVSSSLPDEKKFISEKEEFRKSILREKSQSQMDALLTGLRKDLVPNLTLLKQIFPEEEKEKP